MFHQKKGRLETSGKIVGKVSHPQKSVFFLPDQFGLGPEVKGKLGEIRSLLETLGGTLYPPNFFINIKPGMDNNFC